MLHSSFSLERYRKWHWGYTTLATKKVTIYTEILLSCGYYAEQNLFPRAHLRNIQPAWQSLKLLTRRYLNSGQGNKNLSNLMKSFKAHDVSVQERTEHSHVGTLLRQQLNKHSAFKGGSIYV